MVTKLPCEKCGTTGTLGTTGTSTPIRILLCPACWDGSILFVARDTAGVDRAVHIPKGGRPVSYDLKPFDELRKILGAGG